MNLEKDPRDAGRVADPELAQELAETEDPFHKKTWGIFSPSKRKITKGEQAAEQHRLRGIEITEQELPEEVLNIVKEYKTRFREACKGGKWRITSIAKVDPLIGEKITSYLIDGKVSLHDSYGKFLELDDGTLIIETGDGKVINVDSSNFAAHRIEGPKN